MEHSTTQNIPNNQIWYTSTNGNVVTPNETDVFGATITSNTYSNGKGVITFDGDVTIIGDKAFYDCDKLTSVTLPESVTSIGKKAFYGCDGLTEFTIPDSVTSIGYEAFAYCDSLTSVNIPDSVTSIGEYAFISCDSLTSVNIGDSVTMIGNDAFAYCDSLTSVNIPDSVTTIGEGEFQYCRNLTSVYCKATTPPALGHDVFYDNGSGRKIYVPAKSVEAYKSATRWSVYASVIVGYDFENGVVVE